MGRMGRLIYTRDTYKQWSSLHYSGEDMKEISAKGESTSSVSPVRTIRARLGRVSARQRNRAGRNPAAANIRVHDCQAQIILLFEVFDRALICFRYQLVSGRLIKNKTGEEKRKIG